jgi:(1->4)-alpha-D-glucan 1-alpha-D-glucosylmutase
MSDAWHLWSPGGTWLSMSAPRPFRALYRLQLTPRFGFDEARAVVPYLEELGVSHLYLSPSFEARPGSQHGYDVVDPTRISEERGGEEAFRELCAAGLGVVLDVVPNHMAASDESAYWRDPELRRRFFDWDPESGWYRRFFDVDDLAGVSVEDEEVFHETHAKALELVREGLVDGLRIDHPDGLADPRGYLERLRREGVERVWVEKILEPGERLRDWPVEGTTGYEFAADSTALFVDPAGEEPLTRLYAELTGERRGFHEVAREAEREQAATTFRPEVQRLRALLDDDRWADAVAALPVYRTYVEPWTGRVEEADREALGALPERLRRVLLLEESGHDELVVRFQQTTGAVHAKGVEDTAFYRYNRLLALNEVGGDPARFSLTVADFHSASLERAARFPRQLLTTTTHDTKRSGDVRARIGALASRPEEWAAFARRWLPAAPDPNEGWLILQTLVGAWPISEERLEDYLRKAVREAKVNTSWLAPDEDWEARTLAYARGLVAEHAFVRDVEALLSLTAPVEQLASLGTALLKLTGPGIADLYNGDELPYRVLVDPDNRRPVDWNVRRRALAERSSPKVELIRTALALATEGPYEPLDSHPDVVAFVRGGRVAISVPVRPSAAKSAPGDGWRDLVPTLPVGLYVRERPAPSSYLRA